MSWIDLGLNYDSSGVKFNDDDYEIEIEGILIRTYIDVDIQGKVIDSTICNPSEFSVKSKNIDVNIKEVYDADGYLIKFNQNQIKALQKEIEKSISL